MDRVIQQVKDGAVFFIEISPEPEIVNEQKIGGEQAGIEEKIQQLHDRLDEISSTIAVACESIQSKLQPQRTKGPRIEELTIEFGLKLSAEAGVIMTKVAGEATINVAAKLKFN